MKSGDRPRAPWKRSRQIGQECLQIQPPRRKCIKCQLLEASVHKTSSPLILLLITYQGCQREDQFLMFNQSHICTCLNCLSIFWAITKSFKIWCMWYYANFCWQVFSHEHLQLACLPQQRRWNVGYQQLKVRQRRQYICGICRVLRNQLSSWCLHIEIWRASHLALP